MKHAKKPKKEKLQSSLANVKVIGIGGGGSKAVARMSRNFLRGVDFVAINTDHQDLDQIDVRQKIYIGRNLTRGLGTGMNPDLGRQAAEENRSEIGEAVRGADLVFIAAGLGGGTGSGGAPIVAEAAKQCGALTIAVVTRPFGFEGSQRERIAQEAIVKLKDKVDALIVVPNDRIFTVISKDTPITKAFEAIDDILRNALRGVVELIATPGIINVDFADVRSIVQDAGSAIVSIGISSGAERAVNAVNLALNSPLLETSAEGAKGVLLSISGGRDLRMTEINEAAKIVSQMADPGARIIFGAYHDKQMRPNQIKVTLIATGFNGTSSSGSLFGSGHGNEARSDFFSEFKTSTANPFGAQKQKMDSVPFKKDKKGESGPPSSHLDATGKSKGEERDEDRPLDRAESKKKESDIWDIPTFLRKKRK